VEGALLLGVSEVVVVGKLLNERPQEKRKRPRDSSQQANEERRQFALRERKKEFILFGKSGQGKPTRPLYNYPLPYLCGKVLILFSAVKKRSLRRVTLSSAVAEEPAVVEEATSR